jgi:hypothetical protein
MHLFQSVIEEIRNVIEKKKKVKHTIKQTISQTENRKHTYTQTGNLFLTINVGQATKDS